MEHTLENIRRWQRQCFCRGQDRNCGSSRTRSGAVLMGILLLAPSISRAEAPLAPIPDRLVVLTFDDSVKSHFTIAAPILIRYGFSATFFITEGFTFKTNKHDYMTWEEIRELDRQGFEIGNHTRDHMGIKAANVDQVAEQLRGIDEGCARMGIPKPTSFAWPGNSFAVEALPTLRKQGIVFARRGGMPEFDYDEGRGVAYEPGLDDPLLIPTAGDARPAWTLDDLIRAVSQASNGRIAVLQFHGVPEGEHPWVHTSREQFEGYMNYLHKHEYQVIALRDLARYVDPHAIPADPMAVIERRMRKVSK
jgi:peptidoglycan-N-acetylglucosamine deacetylase